MAAGADHDELCPPGGFDDGLALALVPATWLADMLDATGDGAATFLVRRHAASATAALAVVAIAIVRDTRPRKAVLTGYGTWFAVQAVTVLWGVLSGSVGGLAWAAVIADPLIAAWFLVLSRTNPSSNAAPPASVHVLDSPDRGPAQ